MKKTLLAAALLAGFAGAAQANSVTLYGIVDIGYKYQKERNLSALNALESGAQSGSRIGFKGTEDLGNGLYGNFKLEAGFDSDTGGQKSGLFNRESWLGFGNASWGEVRLGKQRTITGEYSDNIDPFANGFGFAAFSNVAIANSYSNGLMRVANDATPAWTVNGIDTASDAVVYGFGDDNQFNGNDLSRQNNTIKYLSPNWNGFEFGANYSFAAGFDRNTNNGQEISGNSNNDTAYGVALRYTQPQWQVLVSYDRFNNPDEGKGAWNDQGYTQSWQIAGTYDFGDSLANIKLHAAYVNNDYDFGSAMLWTNANAVNGDFGIGSEDEDAFMIGLSAPVGNGKLFGSYYATSSSYLRGYATGAPDVTVNDANGAYSHSYQDKAKAKSWQIGYTYDLSKRTNLYTYFVQTENVTARTNVNNENNDSRVRQFGLGLRHQF